MPGSNPKAPSPERLAQMAAANQRCRDRRRGRPPMTRAECAWVASMASLKARKARLAKKQLAAAKRRKTGEKD